MTTRWIGAAQDVKQVDTITVGGTWLSTETAAITCNNKSLILTLPANQTTAEVADMLKRQVNAADYKTNRLSTETRNFGGMEIPEFAADIEATVSGSVVYLKSKKAGVPFTVSVDDSGSTAGTLTLLSDGTGESVLATGKHFWDNADNWTDGVPVQDEQSVFDVPAPSCLYNLNPTPITGVKLRRTTDFTEDIGLPPWNEGGYAEYRGQYLNLKPNATDVTHELGLPGVRAAQGRTYIDCGTSSSQATTIYVYDSQGIDGYGEAVQIVGGETVDLLVIKGSVRIGGDAAGTATTISRVSVGYKERINQDVILTVGPYPTFPNAAHISGSNFNQYGGTCNLHAAINGGNTTARVFGGTLYATAALNELHIHSGGSVFGIDPDIDEIHVYGGGTLDFSRAFGTSAITSLNLYSGFIVNDPRGVILGEPVNFHGCSPNSGTLVLPNDIDATFTYI